MDSLDSDKTVLTAPPEHDERPGATPAAEPAAGGHGAHGGGIHLPPTSLWPITLAFAITLGASGLVTNWFMAVPAVFLFVMALRGWAKELIHAQQ